MAYRNSPAAAPSADLPPDAFVAFIQNHDQIGNRAFGERLNALAPPEVVRALASVYLLAAADPDAVHGRGVGREAAVPVLLRLSWASSPRRCARGGARNSRAFRSSPIRQRAPRFPTRIAEATFLAAKLDWGRIDANHLGFYRDALAARREHVRPLLPAIERGGEAIVLGEQAVRVAWRAGSPPARPRRQPVRCPDRLSRRPKALVLALRRRGRRVRALERALERGVVTIVPRATYRLQLRAGFGFKRGGGDRALSRAARRQPRLSLAVLQGAARQRARLRHHRPRGAQSGARDGSGLRLDDRGVPARGPRRILDFVPEPYGRRRRRQSAVARRARMGPGVPIRRLVRHRLVGA